MLRRLTNQPTLFSVMVVLFFIWGFITLLNDLLIPVLKVQFQLTYAQAMLIQFCFFFAYFLMSVLMALIVNRINYKKAIIVGLGIIALGCLVFIPAVLTLTYSIFLFALFVLASGIVMLQVSANPLVTLLGSSETSAARLTLAQGVNSLGYVIAPLLMGNLIVSHSLSLPYVIIALIVILVAAFISRFNFRGVEQDIKKLASQDHATNSASLFKLWKHSPFLLGLIGIFVYVGTEVSIGSLTVNFLHLPVIAGFSLTTAAKYLSIYWGGAMLGRLAGSWVLTRFNAAKVLLFCALMNILLLLAVILTSNFYAMWSLLLTGIFNSIMFPTIFSLAIAKLPNEYIKNKASGYLIMAIVGGALIPVLQGSLADVMGLQHSFVLLIPCYSLILLYGIYCSSGKRRTLT